ncbi:MAG TPA: bifunctional phosphoribosyl-AMP cyclohydrolase/phosphoribosyl-ATP diphosphatase HisIE [Clostridiales bacterium]|nr:bifunctional phosphoribosyl-AMP cyclohydrolase/phosphoribosyl-ATP diphosphatase HisIE [Clostridiales bacterium]
MELENIKLQFEERGLLPAIIQDYHTKKVLMLAYMNRESFEKTLETKKTWFYSRSRKQLWNKGETSGNFQLVKRICYDCDGDALLIEVIPLGPACHTGAESCFFNEIFQELAEQVDEPLILHKVYERIQDRKNNPVEGSYTNYLFEKGIDKILKKIGEESSEVLIGAKNDNPDEIIYEVSDLLYHLLVLLVEKEIPLSDIWKELENRYRK